MWAIVDSNRSPYTATERLTARPDQLTAISQGHTVVFIYASWFEPYHLWQGVKNQEAEIRENDNAINQADIYKLIKQENRKVCQWCTLLFMIRSTDLNGHFIPLHGTDIHNV